MRRAPAGGVLLVVVALVAGCADEQTADIAQPAPATTGSGGAMPERLATEHLPNAYRIHAKVISGGQPEGEAAFEELQRLGVKTIISVDGATPDVEMARKRGLRYVHLPFGYDGIPDDRVRALAKAVRDLPGPIYIHCHHGKHRSPAAASVACVGAGFLAPESTVAVLKTAGTSENYRGLYQSAESARRLDDALLDQLDVAFPETADLPPLAEAMVAVEQTHDQLKDLAAAGWTVPTDQPDLDPAHEALLLREHFTELLRTEDVQQRSQRFQDLARDTEAVSERLEEAIRRWQATGQPAPVPQAIAAAFDRVTNNCTACHREFRDVPLSEKATP